MKRTSKNIMKVIAGVSASFVLCGTTALANPLNTPFLQVDINGAGTGPTQSGFQGWSVPAATANGPSGYGTYGLITTTNYGSTYWNPTSITPTSNGAPVTVTIVATNAFNGLTNLTAITADPFPTWAGPVEYSPGGIDRGTSGTLNGETWGPLYEDFLNVSHTTLVGYGEDVISVTVSNLVPNTNYEFTMFDYDTSDSTANYVAWGTTNPANGTYNFQPAHDPLPKLARVPSGGPAPSTKDPSYPEYAYSGSLFVTTDGSGKASVYGWEDDDNYAGAQNVPFNGFLLGYATNMNIIPTTNAFTSNNIVLNPPLTALTPGSGGTTNVSFPYFTAGFQTGYTNYGGLALYVVTNTVGELFVPGQDMELRKFYMLLQCTTNTGLYTFGLYDLGPTNLASVGSFALNDLPPDHYNLLAHPSVGIPNTYWSFAPAQWSLTNATMVEFRLPGALDQVYLTNNHSYFLTLTPVAGTGSNDLVWEMTTEKHSDRMYTNSLAFHYGGPAGSYDQYNQGQFRNFIMAIDAPTPNPVISASTYPLTNATTTWPTLSGMANGGQPVIKVVVDPNNDPTGDYPGTLDFFDTANRSIQYIPGGTSGGAPSMGFFNKTNFNIGAVAVVMQGVGSSNCAFTLNLWSVTNTLMVSTNTVEHWPRNFQPSTDTDPLSVPMWGTNANFYYPTNLDQAYPNGGTDQIMVLTVSTPYQVTVPGTATQPFNSYQVEITAGAVGENTGVGLFRWVDDAADSGWEGSDGTGLTGNPNGPGFIGWPPGAASPTTNVYAAPFALARMWADDPETYAGMVAGTTAPRQMVMAIYAADPNAAAMPVISPNVGTFDTSSLTVTLTCATAGATIYYTTDGTTPTTGSASVSSGGTFTLSSSAVVKAMATASGKNPSAVATAGLTVYQSTVNPTSVTITNVTRSAGSTVLSWTETGGSGAYTYSVWSTTSLNAPITWTQLATGLSAATTTYTDSTATGANTFYRVSSP